MPAKKLLKKKTFLDQPLEHYSWAQSGTYVDSNTNESYLLPNNKQFVNWVTDKYDKLRKIKGEDEGKTPLFPHQRFIREYMGIKTPYRGLLLYHGLGSGKTRSGVTPCEVHRAHGVKILVILPATLRPTWYNEIKMWGNSDVRRPDNYSKLSPKEQEQIDAKLDDRINKYYTFVSYNASNAVSQLKKAVGSVLRHRFVVVDEVHNLVSMMVSSSSKQGRAFYKTLMDAVDCKFLFLSATPLLNFPFELGIMFNILRGYMTHNGQKYSLFPEDEVEFETYFVNYTTKKIINPKMFKKRISGLVSYYYGAKGDVYPDLIMHPPIEVEFSDHQFSQYSDVRLIELDKEKKSAISSNKNKKLLANLSGKSSKNAKNSKKTQVSSLFRLYSREVSNFSFPPGIKRPYKSAFSNLVDIKLHSNPEHWSQEQVDEFKKLFNNNNELYTKFQIEFASIKDEGLRTQLVAKTIQEHGGDISEFSGVISEEEQFIYANTDQKVSSTYDDAIIQSLNLLDLNADKYFNQMLDILSPKMDAIYRNLMDSHGNDGPALVYSNFRSVEGVEIFSRVLKARGFEPLPYHQINSSNIENYVGKNRYVIYSGSEDLEIRDRILSIFNHPLNKEGKIARVFLGTAAAAEGISLKNTRQVHILEPHWNNVRIQQVIGRARRIFSHHGLDVSKRQVFVYLYHSVMSDKQKKKFIEDISTDQAIFKIARDKEIINAQFLQLLKDGAVDCKLNANDNIAPDNPIDCFIYNKNDVGTSYYPNIDMDGVDSFHDIHYKQQSITFADYYIGPKDKSTNDYKYVYKYVGNPINIKKETIEVTRKGQTRKFTAIVLYDKLMAESGMLSPKVALIEYKGKEKPIANFKLI